MYVSKEAGSNGEMVVGWNVKTAETSYSSGIPGQPSSSSSIWCAWMLPAISLPLLTCRLWILFPLLDSVMFRISTRCSRRQMGVRRSPIGSSIKADGGGHRTNPLNCMSGFSCRYNKGCSLFVKYLRNLRVIILL